ncbi:hypothetical protein GQ457_14G017100 [Hibiscus cannabinus]
MTMYGYGQRILRGKEAIVFCRGQNHSSQVHVDKDLLRAVAQFWNPLYNCFTFNREDLTPTIEEYVALLHLRKVQEFEVYVKGSQPKTYMEKLVTLTGTNVVYLIGFHFLGFEGRLDMLRCWSQDNMGHDSLFQLREDWDYASLSLKIWRTKRKNCKIPSPSHGKALTLEEQFKVVPTEVEIVRQEFEEEKQALNNRIAELEARNQELDHRVTYYQGQSDMFEKELNRVNVDFKYLQGICHNLEVKTKNAGLRKTPEEWEAELHDRENDTRRYMKMLRTKVEQFARGDIKVREDLMGEALIQIRRVVECVTSLAKEAEWLKFWINPSTHFVEEWIEFLRRFKQFGDRARPYRPILETKDDQINHPHYTRFKAKRIEERLQKIEKFQEQVTQDMKNLRDELEKSQENLLTKLEDKLSQLLSKTINAGKGKVQEFPEEDSSSLPRKPQETHPRFVFSAGGLQSNVQNPTNLHGASDLNMWASLIKTDVLNFNDPIELEKLIEEQSKDFGATDDKFKYLEERIKAIEGTDAFIGTDAMGLSLVPDLILPPNFKVPEFEKFDGTSCPNAHLTMFYRKLTGYGNDDKLLIHCLQDSLTGSAMRWYNQLNRVQVNTWRKLACAFKEQYKHVLDMVPDRLTLQNIGKKDKESFREYAQRWRNIAAQVQPPLLEKETTNLFINSLESTHMYYARLVGITTRDFVDLVTAGEAIERAIKSGKLNYPEASKKTHNKRRETEVNMVESGRRSYTNYQSSPQIIYPTTYSKPVADPSWQRTQSQGEPKSLKASKEKQTFTPISIPYKDLFTNLLEERLISPIFLTPLQPPYLAWYDPSAYCEYHAGIPRHSIKNCMAFKRRVQHLINQNVIQLNTSQGPNVANNPLPAHDEPRVNAVTSDNGTKIKTNISEVLSPLKWVWE